MRYTIVSGILLWSLASALPSAEPVQHVTRGLGLIATADVYVCNDYPADVTCTTSDNYKMGTQLADSFVVPHGKCANAQRVKATWIPFVQSQFNFNFGGKPKPAGYSIKIGKTLIGKSPTTSISAAPGNPAFEGAALLAPQNPLGGEPDYNMYIYGGQNMLAPIINSLVASKIPAVAEGLKTNPATLPLPIKGLSAKINGIPTNIQATYAGIRSMAGTKWNANALIAVSGDITGSLYIDLLKTDVPFKISLGNLQLLANVDLDITTFKATINSLQTSLDELAVSSELLGALNKIGADILKFFKAAKDICGIVNTDYNAKVLEIANAAIANGLPGGTAKRDLETLLSEIAKRQLQ